MTNWDDDEDYEEQLPPSRPSDWEFAHSTYQRFKYDWAKTNDGVDRLSTLAPELLHKIFDYVYGNHEAYNMTSWKRGYPALCKAIQPFAEEYLYRVVYIKSHWQIFHLVQWVLSNPERFKRVHELSLDFAHLEYALELFTKRGKPHVARNISEFWGAFTKLEKLTITYECGEVSHHDGFRVMDRAFGRQAGVLPALTLVSVELRFSRAYHTSTFTSLFNAGPNIKTFMFVYAGPGDTLERGERSAGVLQWPAVRSFGFVQHNPLNRIHTKALLNAMPNITELLLQGVDFDDRMNSLLEDGSLRALESLTVANGQGYGSGSSLNLRESFPALRCFVLSDDWETDSLLAKLPKTLEELQFSLHNQITTAGLTSLLTPGHANHLPQLKKLRCDNSRDHSRAERAPSVQENEGNVFLHTAAYLEGEPVFQPDSNWDMFAWGRDFSFANCDQLIQLAKSQGVQVTAIWVEAVQIQHEFIAEKQLCTALAAKHRQGTLEWSDWKCPDLLEQSIKHNYDNWARQPHLILGSDIARP